MDPVGTGFPSQKDLEREISDYLSKKYGGKIRVVSQMVFPNQMQNSADDGKGRPTNPSSPPNFNLKPEELEAYLSRYVIKQDEAKAILATKVCTHFNRISYLARQGGADRQPVGNIKNNIILIGPTGVGKTFMVKLIAEKLGVPFVKGDATKFSETGYVGGDVEDLVRELVQAADGDIEKAQYGIIYIDEIDKIASPYHVHGPDVSRAGVQRALLKPMEETEVELKVPHDPISQIEAIEQYRKSGKRQKRTINTRNILFIVSGAFSGLADIIKKRLARQGIGFGANIEDKEEQDWLKQVKPQDLVEYGFENEFIGRLPIIAVLEELTEEDLFEILRNPNCSVIISKKQDFRSYGIDLKFEEEALRLLAHQAYQEGTGARALVSVIERALLPFEKRLPSLGHDFLVVTRKMVEDPEGELKRLERSPDDPAYFRAYQAILNEEIDMVMEELRQADPWDRSLEPLTEERLMMIASLAVMEDMSKEAAADRVYYLISQVKSYETSFFNRCGITLSFTDEAVDRIVAQGIKDINALYSMCERVCNILEHGLSLVRERTGKEDFTIDTWGVENPESFLNKLLREAGN